MCVRHADRKCNFQTPGLAHCSCTAEHCGVLQSRKRHRGVCLTRTGTSHGELQQCKISCVKGICLGVSACSHS